MLLGGTKPLGAQDGHVGGDGAGVGETSLSKIELSENIVAFVDKLIARKGRAFSRMCVFFFSYRKC
ncbi:hypothetical protein Tdes44962_MAKER03150 [Teratosphaeria destructans]|uniref:Uncharacterized protein n=1 Tax=Teratosphaeria destructans TaxID=418781 RepID=A0A9W7SR48_9PEZI|nr:hypothetical protein Tdes44962_MAKER03150 [Teratosphaeria destructans]